MRPSPLIPAQAGIQVQLLPTLNLRPLGPRFRGDERVILSLQFAYNVATLL